jgi:predicted RNA-binding protein Jag
MKSLLLFLSFALFSCSRVDMGVRYLEYSGTKEITQLFEFSGAKQKSAKTILDKFLKSAKKKVLPLVSKRLLQIKASSQPGELVQALPEELKADFAVMKAESEEVVEVFVSQIDKEEFKSLIKNYQEKIEKEQEHNQDLESSNSKIKEKVYQGFDYFLDDLTKDQKAEVETFFAKERYPFQLQLESKRENLNRLRKTDGEQNALKKLARDYLESPESLELKSFRQARKDYFQKLAQMISTVLKTLSPEQKKHFESSLTKLSGDLLEISQKASE